jgi:hypothetical protein
MLEESACSRTVDLFKVGPFDRVERATSSAYADRPGD